MKILLVLLLFATTAQAEEIPLDTIWGYDLPGTRDVRKLEPIIPLDKATVVL